MSLRKCPYEGSNCPFLGDPDHILAYSHPSPPKKCPYKTLQSCPFLSDPDHLSDYLHDPTPVAPKQACPYGAACQFIAIDPDHKGAYLHECRYGMFCTKQKEKDHTTYFLHTERERTLCTLVKCPQVNDSQHCSQFTHKCDHKLKCEYLSDNKKAGYNEHLMKYLHPCLLGTKCPKIHDKNHSNKKTHDDADIIKEYAEAIFPLEWTSIKESNKTKFELVKVPATSTEYRNVINHLNSNGAAGKYTSVASLERVENRDIWTMYRARKLLMKNPNEQILFNGAKINDRNHMVDITERVGFDFRADKMGAHFAKLFPFANQMALHNSDNTKEIIICKVLVGDTTPDTGKPELRPPLNPKTSCLFDSINYTDTIAVYELQQAYPAYILKYY
eukprot:TRINITY_DN9372_c4_g1_i1.p1 TRINITY_DN9372_c4_g1~~TRINITY_DN9372_c4_g1_i1.p1  ORF type:complete len:388 (+),score=67.15 TRINITY_DN9372_c4_g1_i1:15-1178(+)